MKVFAKSIFEDFLREQPNFAFFLEGALGAGKTFFIREVLRHFGVEREVGSPTYIFLNEYKAGGKDFAHFDFYRLPHPDEFFARGFNEIAEHGGTSAFIEWPDKISREAHKTFSGKKFLLRIDHGTGVGMRTVKLLEV